MTHPIRRWSLRNFKSVESADVEFAPLTVLVGPNSSGKSSLIQSILLATQAARSGRQALLPLNGPLVELGDFQDVLFAGEATDLGASDVVDKRERSRFRIGGDFEMPSSRDPFMFAPRGMGRDDRRAHLSWEAAFAGGGGHGTLGAAQLVATVLTLTMPDVEEEALHFETTSARRKKLDLGTVGRYFAPTAAVTPLRGKLRLGYHRSLRVAARERRPQGVTDEGRPTLVTTSGLGHASGIPTELYVEEDKGVLIAEEALRGLMRQAIMHPQRNKGLEAASSDVKSSDDVIKRLVDLLSEYVAWELSENGEAAGRVAAERESLTTDLLRLVGEHRGLFRKQPELRSRVPEEVGKRVGSGVKVLSRLDQVPGLPFSYEYLGWPLVSFLAQNVLYLGPLREDPRVVYLPTPSERAGNVGRKGESAIALLHAFGSQPVLCPHHDREARSCSLLKAVGYWIQEFGLAEEIDTDFRPRLGLEPHLTLQDVTKPLDMTSVGVGVSQVLPVLVMGLHSQPGSVLLMEQPELHLHPALQQKLGDFLLACARSGRQLIVETHSDHLVSRLRRRVAEDEADDVRRYMSLIFTEREDGRTRYRTVEISRYGGIEDWPTGFFDQMARESQRIIKAGIAKKRLDSETGRVD